MEGRDSLGSAVPGELLMKVGNKWFVIPGFGLLAVSLVGIVLSVGTLVTVSSNQEALVEKTIEQYVSMLKYAGLPQEIVERFKLEESTDEAAFDTASLSVPRTRCACLSRSLWSSSRAT